MVYVCMYVCMYVCIAHVLLCICAFAWMYMCFFFDVYVFLLLCICVFAFVYMSLYNTMTRHARACNHVKSRGLVLAFMQMSILA